MPKKGSQHATAPARALPPCPGPKLHRFRHWNAPIEWLERLDENRASNPVSQGYVFKVKIKSQYYAIKVFKFFNPEASRWYWEPYLGESFPLEMVAFHTDPFYAECRAYGQIGEKRKKGYLKRDVAVPCHGYLFLNDVDKAVLQGMGIDLEEEQLIGIPVQDTGRTNQIRAIIKDLAPQESGVSSATLSQILRDIRLLNKFKIYNRDIRAENFRGGLLVDFGSALTEPNCMMEAFERKDKEEAVDTRLEDLVKFDNMVEEESIATNVRARPNVEFCQKLRSWSNYS